MSRIVITTIGSLGDLHPKIAIALELRDRGHQVVFATHKEYKDKIEALGFEFHRMRPDNTALSDPQEMARMMDLKKGTEYVINHWVLPSLKDTYTDLASCANKADFILAGEGVLAARLVAEKLDIPWASVVLQPLAFLSIHEPFVLPVLPALSKLRVFGSLPSRGIRQLSKMMAKPWAAPVHKFRHDLGLPPLVGNPFIDDKYPPNLVLALFSSIFAKPQPDWPKNTVQTGFVFFDGGFNKTPAPIPKLQDFLDNSEPPIVFTLGSAAVMSPGSFYQDSIQASQRLNRRAVLLVGKNPPPNNLPDNVIAIDYAPYSQIFPAACAIVHQGGIGTTAQALRAGRPTLIMPYSHDQPDNAARAEQLGTSRTLSRKRYSAATVERKLRNLLDDPSFATKAAKVANILQSEQGESVACDAIERQLP